MKCGVTKKVMFKSYGHATNKIGEILDNKDNSNRKFTPNMWRAYSCEYCGGWHITTKR